MEGKIKFSIYVATCYMLASISFALADQRIYGGYPIDITDAPYMVHISLATVIFANGSGIAVGCGGAILRKNLILTAGHCELIH